jgi:hypothetical protein
MNGITIVCKNVHALYENISILNNGVTSRKYIHSYIQVDKYMSYNAVTVHVKWQNLYIYETNVRTIHGLWALLA